MNQALAKSPTSRLAGTISAIDATFPLLWVGLYLLLPVSGWSDVMFRSWFDQKLYLSALRSLVETGHADAVSQNLVGPAFLATARLLHDVAGLGPADALVVLNRASYVLSVSLGLVLVRGLVRSLTGAPPTVTLGAQFAFVGFVFAVGTWHWSDVPWSHFLAAFLAVGVFVGRFAPSQPSLVSAAATGAVLALLSLTRTFEFATLLLAWGIVWLAFSALRLTDPPLRRMAHVATGFCAFAVTSAAVYALSGKRELFILYSTYLDKESGPAESSELVATPTFSASFLPTKLVQLFVEPCFFALCSLSDYAGGALRPPPDLLPSGVESGGNERLWRLPLVVQLPSLALLPLCLIVTVILIILVSRNRPYARERVRAIRGVAEMSVASIGIVLGYTASTISGSPHLRYGLARDFLLPALLGSIVVVVFVSAGIWRMLSRSPTRWLGPESAFVALCVVGSALVVGGLAYARASGIPRITGKQLGSVVYTASCSGRVCSVRVDATTPRGTSISIPDASTLIFACPGDRGRIAVYTGDLDRVEVASTCDEPRLAAAWPTVMGLPPGSFELSAVGVRNA